jgi:hypothetical protein
MIYFDITAVGMFHLALSPQMPDTYMLGRHRGGKMGTIAATSKLAESTKADQFIPVRKEDLLSALIEQGDLANPVERELFWRFARTLAPSVTTNIPRRSIGCAMIITILIPRSQAIPRRTT